MGDPYHRKQGTLYLFEVGYSNDTMLATTRDAKTAKYEELVAALKAAGWTNVRLIVIPLGCRGGIPVYLRQILLDLKLYSVGNAKAVDSLLERLTDSAATHLSKLMHTKRHMEATLHTALRADAAGEPTPMDRPQCLTDALQVHPPLTLPPTGRPP